MNSNPQSIISAVCASRLTYLEESALNDLYGQVAALESRGAEGILIEAGCALGGSAIVMAAAKSADRPLQIYDVFGMIPEPSERDGADVHNRYEIIRSGQSAGIDGEKYYGYEENLLEKVEKNFDALGFPVKENHVQLIKGLFQDTLEIQQKVALAHIDGDWYESVMVCLQRIVPNLIQGGILVIDDFQSWSGCREAVQEYFVDKKDDFEFVMKSRLHIIRK